MKFEKGWWFPDQDTLIPSYMKQDQDDQLWYFHKDGIEKFLGLSDEENYRTFIDIGGHIGLVAKPVSFLFDTVISFEPNPTNYECFEKNLEGIDNVTLHKVGLNDQHTRFSKFRFDDPKNSGMVGVNLQDKDDDAPFELKRLDDYQFDNVDFVKIDVEGLELSVVKGALETFEKHHPLVMIEINYACQFFGKTPQNVFNEIRDLSKGFVDQVDDCDYVFQF